MPKKLWSDALAYTVAIRVDGATMEKLQFAQLYEGIRFGQFVRSALEDYFAGVGWTGASTAEAYQEWSKQRDRPRAQSMQRWIAERKMRTPIEGG